MWFIVYKLRVHVYCVPKHYGGPWTNKLVAAHNLIQVFVTKVEEMHVIDFVKWYILYYLQEKELQSTASNMLNKWKK